MFYIFFYLIYKIINNNILNLIYIVYVFSKKKTWTFVDANLSSIFQSISVSQYKWGSYWPYRKLSYHGPLPYLSPLSGWTARFSCWGASVGGRSWHLNDDSVDNAIDENIQHFHRRSSAICVSDRRRLTGQSSDNIGSCLSGCSVTVRPASVAVTTLRVSSLGSERSELSREYGVILPFGEVLHPCQSAVQLTESLRSSTELHQFIMSSHS